MIQSSWLNSSDLVNAGGKRRREAQEGKREGKGTQEGKTVGTLFEGVFVAISVAVFFLR